MSGARHSPRSPRPASPTRRGSSRPRAVRAAPPPRRGSREQLIRGAILPAATVAAHGGGSLSRVSAVELKTLPWSWYTDPAVLQLERERIFRRSWQYVGHEGDVPEPGSFAASCRRRSGRARARPEDTLRAFLNVCRHRARSCEGSGRRETLQCPTTPGRTASTVASSPPRAEQGGRDPQGGARARPSAARHLGSAPLRQPGRRRRTTRRFLDGIPERIAEAGIDLDALRFLQRSSPSSTATGRSPRRTSSSATTARPHTRGSPRSWT